jgi:hypothetical protein
VGNDPLGFGFNGKGLAGGGTFQPLFKLIDQLQAPALTFGDIPVHAQGDIAIVGVGPTTNRLLFVLPVKSYLLNIFPVLGSP